MRPLGRAIRSEGGDEGRIRRGWRACLGLVEMRHQVYFGLLSEQREVGGKKREDEERRDDNEDERREWDVVWYMFVGIVHGLWRGRTEL